MKKFSWMLILPLLAACEGPQDNIKGDRDDTDIFAVPLDNSGPADERELELLEEEQTK